jgi:uncharacterized membrane protein
MSQDTFANMAQKLLEADEGELRPREKKVLEKILKRLAISRYVEKDYLEQSTFGQRIADRVAEIGGSWSFIIGFFAFIFVWISINTWILLDRSYDPYPFILLNLALSLLAAVQAPIILMSQNRQTARDRLAAEHDYEVNLKAEIEIAALHEKLDQIRANELAILCRQIQHEMAHQALAGGPQSPR